MDRPIRIVFQSRVARATQRWLWVRDCRAFGNAVSAVRPWDRGWVWAGHVSTQKMAVFDSYSSRSGEIFFNEIYKSSKQINSQKTSQSILFLCRAKFGTNQLKSMKTPSMFSKIYRYFWRFSTTGKAASAKLHLSVSMQVVIHTKFAFSRLEQYDYCYD